jgi:ADP-ribosylglycohydrolase
MTERIRAANRDMSENVISSCRGALLGMAAGDALGTTLEFKPPGSFQPIEDMVGGGPFGLRAGEWTDDTSMGLCLAESLLECGGFDPVDQIKRYLRWWQEGRLSSNGRCFDIGAQTSEALAEFERTGSAQPLPPDRSRAGNGSIMRLAAVPVAYGWDIEAAIEYSGRSSLTTHPAPQSVDACRYLGSLIAAAVSGASKDELLDEAFWRWGELDPEVDEVARGSFKRRQPPEIMGTGYCVRTLEAALWALHWTGSFREGALRVVNLGDDADTTGAVYGQLAGALYGEEGIPATWREKLALQYMIRRFADRLCKMHAVEHPGVGVVGTSRLDSQERQLLTGDSGGGLLAPVAATSSDRERTSETAAVTSIEEFRDDDTGYLNWIAAHQDGFVLNIRRDLNPGDAKLHRASCGYVSGQNPLRGPWTDRYIKFCSLELAALEEGAPPTRTGEPINRCRRCWPSSTKVVVGSGSKEHATKSRQQPSRPRTSPARTEVHGPLLGQPVVEAWTDEYIRFEHRSAEQESLRAEIRARVRTAHGCIRSGSSRQLSRA